MNDMQDVAEQMGDASNLIPLPGDPAPAPAAPVEPVAPVAPVEPVAPVDPVVPVAPVEPVAPVAPAAEAKKDDVLDNDKEVDSLISDLDKLLAEPKKEEPKKESPEYDPTAFAGKPGDKKETEGGGKAQPDEAAKAVAAESEKSKARIAELEAKVQEYEKKTKTDEETINSSNELWENALKDKFVSPFLRKFLEAQNDGKEFEISEEGLRLIRDVLDGKKLDYKTLLRERAKSETAAIAKAPSAPAPAKAPADEEDYSDTLSRALPR